MRLAPSASYVPLVAEFAARDDSAAPKLPTLTAEEDDRSRPCGEGLRADVEVALLKVALRCEQLAADVEGFG